MKRGDVFYLRYDNSYGSEMAVGRPVVVVSSQQGIDSSPVVTVAFLTTKYKNMNVNVEVRHQGRISYVLCNQLQTVDVEKLSNQAWSLTEREMQEVDEHLLFALGLENVEDEKSIVEETYDESIEMTRLKVELDTYKRLYESLTSQIVDARFERNLVMVGEKAAEAAEAVVKLADAAPKLNVDTEDLKQTMMGAEPKKPGRKPTSGKYCRPKLEDLTEYAKKGRANINTDGWKVIAATAGVPVQTAQAIVCHRNKYGEFKSLTDLLDVPRVGASFFDKYGNKLEV